MIRKTQVNSLKQLKPKMANRQATILKVIKDYGPISNREIAIKLTWEINRVTGRVSELVDKGKVKSDGTKLDSMTNRTVTMWSIY